MVEGVPVQKVLDMRSRGADNNAVIEALRSEGYSFQQIRDAVQQADLKKTVGTAQMASPAPATQQVQQAPVQAPNIPAPQMQASPMMQQIRPNIDIDEIQRVLEEIIEEKWHESEEKLVKINEWRAAINTKVKEFDTRIAELNTRIDGLNNILGKKAEAFDETMRSVDTEIKALEKSLNKIVPILSDNIGELRELVGGLKGSKPESNSQSFKPRDSDF